MPVFYLEQMLLAFQGLVVVSNRMIWLLITEQRKELCGVGVITGVLGTGPKVHYALWVPGITASRHHGITQDRIQT